MQPTTSKHKLIEKPSQIVKNLRISLDSPDKTQFSAKTEQRPSTQFQHYRRSPSRLITWFFLWLWSSTLFLLLVFSGGLFVTDNASIIASGSLESQILHNNPSNLINGFSYYGNRPSKTSALLFGKGKNRPIGYPKHRIPYNIILVLPSRESRNDEFRMTLFKTQPVIDTAFEDTVNSGIMPSNWMNITYHDSRYWEDKVLAERYAATGVVRAFCERRLDAIFGFADAYSLATVSKISADFDEGIPVLTTTGLNSLIGSKKSYPFVTRMSGSNSQIAKAAYQFIAKDEGQDNDTIIDLHYKNLVFMYHDKRRAMNRAPVTIGESTDESPSSHCYFSLHAIKNYFRDNSEYFKESWLTQTPHVAFDEVIGIVSILLFKIIEHILNFLDILKFFV